MKTIFAVEKSEYLHSLMILMNYNIPLSEREIALDKMAEIEKQVKKQGDEIQIIITTKKTIKTGGIPPMSQEDIKKSKENKK